MTKRVITKIGDVFSVPINENEKRYMQLIAFDLTQLNSDVIRAFEKIYLINEHPSLDEIIRQRIFFHAHCVTKFGIKLNLWEKVGNVSNVESINNIIFRGTPEYARKKGEAPILISNQWYIWRINDEKFTKVGKLEGENRMAEIGLIVNPYDILERMKTGKYNFYYPDFE